MQEISLTEMRKKVDDNLDLKINKKHFLIKLEDNYLKKQQNNEAFHTIPNYIIDEQFTVLFNSKKSQMTDTISEEMYCLFTSPLNETWQDFLFAKSDSSFIFRTGFYSQEYDIYDSILKGFDGLFIYCDEHDVYQIQLLTEIARDYNFTLIFLAHNKRQINTILETDAPYIAISGINSGSLKQENHNLIQLANIVPKTAKLMAWTKKITPHEKRILHHLGYEIFFECY